MDRVVLDEEDFKSFVQCPVCMSEYHATGPLCPRVLPCSHTVCCCCLARLSQHGASPRLTCPECRSQHLLPAAGPSGFPRNLVVVKILGTTVLSACHVCGKEGKHRKCSHCAQKLCAGCVVAHIEAAKTEAREIAGSLRAAQEESNQKISCIRRAKIACCHRLNAVSASVDKAFDSLEVFLKKRKLVLLDELSDHVAPVFKRSSSVVGKLGELTTSLVTCSSSLEKTLSDKTAIVTEAQVKQMKVKSQNLSEIMSNQEDIMEDLSLTVAFELDEKKCHDFFDTLGSLKVDKSNDIGLVNTFISKAFAEASGDEIAEVGEESEKDEGVTFDYKHKIRVRMEIMKIPDGEEERPWAPIHISTCRSTGKVLVCERGRVHVFDANLKFLYSCGDVDNGSPVCFKNIILISVAKPGWMLVFQDRSDGIECRKVNHRCTRVNFIPLPAGMGRPHDVAVDDMTYQIYLVDREKNGIYVLDKKGKELLRIGFESDEGCDHKRLHLPEYIAVSDDYLLVTESIYGGHRVQMLDKGGNHLRFIGQDDGACALRVPKGVAIDNTGHMIIADAGEKSVKVFTQEGELVANIKLDLFVDMFRFMFVARSKLGELVVCSEGAHGITVI